MESAFAVYPCEYHIAKLNRVSWTLTLIKRRIQSDERTLIGLCVRAQTHKKRIIRR